MHNSPDKKTSLMPIAVIGMAVRFPGDVTSPEAMWRLLVNGKSAISRIPDERWPVWELSHPKRGEAGRSVSFSAGILENMDEFDNEFFKISPREAVWMDPQQRLLLEMAHEAMEDAGIAPDNLAGGHCGVYIGISGMDYGQNALEDLSSMSAYTMTGNTLSIAANRLSYVYDLHGPSVAVDTACSSSLTAIHHACQAIRNGEIPMALAGGINLLMHPYSFIGFSHAAMLSATGSCRPFDAAADGYVRGEGGALVLLKPLPQALADHDHIHALILGTGINSDGARKKGLTIPSSEAQSELMDNVLKASGLSSGDVDFVEAHGTGTPVGDPVEAKSIGEIYGAHREQPMPISSAKANFGHLEPASGMVGLVKAILSLRHGCLPPMALKWSPSPAIDFNKLNIYCAANGCRLDKHGNRPLAGAVNSFGFGGLNAHLLLTEAPAVSTSAQEAEKMEAIPLPPLFLGAQNNQALKSLALSYANFLETLPVDKFYDFTFSAAFTRSLKNERLAIWADTIPEYKDALMAWAEGESASHAVHETVLPQKGKMVFVYSGNGAQWHGMGKRLYDESPEFAAIMDMLDAKMSPIIGWPLLETLLHGEEHLLDATIITQPLLFAIQTALTLLLQRMGLVPAATVGHSVGEIAAAWAAGKLSLEQAIQVIQTRSEAQDKTFDCGRMAATGLSADDALVLIRSEGLGNEVEIAAANSPSNCTITGNAAALELLAKILKEKGIFFRQLDLKYAFHSVHMESQKDFLMRKLADLKPVDEKKAQFVSTVTGAPVGDVPLEANYWWRNMREPVDFASAIKNLAGTGANIFVEIGPHAVLQRYIRENLGARAPECRILSVMQRSGASLERVKNIAASLHLLTARDGFAALFPRSGGKLKLPLYPWQHQKYWYPRTTERVPPQKRRQPLAGWLLTDGCDKWENILDPQKDMWLEDHQIEDATVFPAAAWLELALEAGRDWLDKPAVALENFDILLPLVFDNRQPQTLRCSINPADGFFHVSGHPRLCGERWIEYAHGRIIATSIPGTMPIQAPPVLPHEWTGSQLYDAAAKIGLNYGPYFRRIEHISFSDRQLTAILATQPETNFILDPGALDAAFHSIIVFQALQKEKCAFLPVGLSKIEVYNNQPPVRIEACLRRVAQRGAHVDFLFLDKDGAPVTYIEDCRFRRMAARAGREKISSWTVKPHLRPNPKTEITAKIGDLTGVRKAALKKLGDMAVERRQWFQEILPRLEAATLACITTLPEILPPEQWPDLPFHQWLKSMLAQYEPAESGGIPDWRELWREAYNLAPSGLAALLPLGRLLENLGASMAAEEDPADLLLKIRKNIIADDTTADNPAYAGINTAINGIVCEMAAAWPKSEVLRILDISENPTGIKKELTTILPEDHFDYVHVSATDLTGEKANGSAHAPQSADYAQWLENNSPDAGWDYIILRQIVHTADDLPSVMGEINRHLKHGGLLLLAERHPDWSAEILDGLESWWWRPNGQNQVVSSRMSPEEWTQLVMKADFQECVYLKEPEAGDLPMGAFLLLARKNSETVTTAISINPSAWHLAHDAASENLARSLRDCLEANSQTVTMSGEQTGIPENTRHVVCLFSPAKPEDLPATLNIIKKYALEAMELSSPPIFWIVTRGGAVCSQMPDAYASNPMQAALTGFGRVLANEYPALRTKLLDINSGSEEMAASLAREMLDSDDLDEIIITDHGRFFPELEKTPPAVIQADCCRLDFSNPGRLDNLAWLADSRKEPVNDEIEARVMAVGLNFRDVMLTMGLLPEDAIENGFAGPTLGLEFSGIVTAAGPNAKFAVGDRVTGFAPACFASHVRTVSGAVMPMPADMDFASASAIPTIFMTAWYALKHLGDLRPGETVLVHGGAGGVGMAAIQIARLLGAKVYATAGTPEKRDFLKLLGVDAVFDSRSLDFADQIMRMTHGKGIDVVLNSLAGEAMRRSIALLKPFGRFLELGKRDYVENTSISLRPFKENISYFSIDVDQLLTARPGLATRLFKEVVDHLHNRRLLPPPVRKFGADQIVDAFRALQQSRHMGKIVIDMEKLPSIARPADADAKLDLSGTWLVSGGLGGFGLETARHLARLGARHLVLASRQGESAPQAQTIIGEFKQLGLNIKIYSCDMANAGAVSAMIEEIGKTMPPLSGIVHAAAVFADRWIKDMDMESLREGIEPKLAGAWNLHAAVKNLPLAHFIVYSSISVSLGNPGQANYVAANSGLEGLVRMRLEAGLPATCLGWGPVGDAGYLTRNTEVRKSLSHYLGMPPLEVADAMRIFGQVAPRNGIYILANVDWNGLPLMTDRPPARFARLREAQKHSAATRNGDDLASIIRQLPPREAIDRLETCVMEETAKVLGLKRENIRSHSTLQSLGLDSLMAMELALSLEQATGLRLPAMLLQDAPTVRQLAERLRDRLYGQEHDEMPEAILRELARQHSETLAPEEIRKMVSDVEDTPR